MEDTFDLYDDLEEFQQKQEEVKLRLGKFRIELLSLQIIYKLLFICPKIVEE